MESDEEAVESDGGDKQQVNRPEGGKPPVTGLLGGERPQPA